MIFVTLPVSLILKALHYRHADRDAAADRAFAGDGNERYDPYLRRTGTRTHKHSSMQLSVGWGRHKCNVVIGFRFEILNNLKQTPFFPGKSALKRALRLFVPPVPHGVGHVGREKLTATPSQL